FPAGERARHATAAGRVNVAPGGSRRARQRCRRGDPLPRLASSGNQPLALLGRVRNRPLPPQSPMALLAGLRRRDGVSPRLAANLDRLDRLPDSPPRRRQFSQSPSPPSPAGSAVMREGAFAFTM